MEKHESKIKTENKINVSNQESSKILCKDIYEVSFETKEYPKVDIKCGSCDFVIPESKVTYNNGKYFSEYIKNNHLRGIFCMYDTVENLVEGYISIVKKTIIHTFMEENKIIASPNYKLYKVPPLTIEAKLNSDNTQIFAKGVVNWIDLCDWKIEK